MRVPQKIQTIINKLEKNNYQAYLVGGCVRDLIRKVEPKDWDVATNVNPEQIRKVFPKSFIDNKFGTVNVSGVEITPFRTEEKYTDKRHPDSVKWAKSIEEDLARRDFTINAMALSLKSQIPNPKIKIIDLYDGQKDLEKKIIRAVGEAEDRFSEDALRMMRAVRFASVLDFRIEDKTAQAIKKNSPWIQAISKERIKDEFFKIIMADKAAEGIEMLRELELLKYIIPELEQGYKILQAKHHKYDCYQHAVFSLKYAAEQNFNKYVRLASLFHDIGKPKSKRGTGEEATFYGHEVVGARMTSQILERLRFSRKEIEKIVKLVRYHLFYYNVGEVSEASVRRLVRKVGLENINELIQVRMADRIGSGCPKAEPYKLRHLRYIIERVSRDPISVKMLKINGNDLMKLLNIKPGPKIGIILDILLGFVLADPKNNKKNLLEKEIKKLARFSDQELSALADKSKKERDKIVVKQDSMTKNKYWVT
jgi:poly(A) polymerase/tRNA nucleotidyltransferase (CCA-adding enzyme)